MSVEKVICVLLILCVVHVLGYFFSKLHQPRLIGEMAAGIVLGPFVMGHLFPFVSEYLLKNQALLDVVSKWGLILLMFLSGAHMHRVFVTQYYKTTAWILGLGTPLPVCVTFVLGYLSWIPVEPLMGAAGHRFSTLWVVSIAVAVTSIPVISRIFYELKIIHTRFAGLVLGAAILEDIILWTVLALAMTFQSSTVNVVFAAFLAGCLVRAIVGVHFAKPLYALEKISFAFFIPIYFFMVGYQLVLGREFSAVMLIQFWVGSSVLALLSVGLAARFAGFRKLDVFNVAITMNARGGPGIVLATVAYEAEMISGAFYTTLVLTSILTSQMAYLWLRYVLKKGWPLLVGVKEAA